MTQLFNRDHKTPNLTSENLIKKIIQNKPISIQTKMQNYIIDYIKKYYKVIIVVLIILVGLYWRYNDIKKKKEKNKL
jgi:putative Mn2+ efflux pump MntP